MKKRFKILFIATLPPPVHGSAVVSQQIKESKLIRETFDCEFVNLSLSRKIDEIGKMKIVKIGRLLCPFFILFWKLLTTRYDLCYISLTCHGIGFLKDAPYALLCHLFGRKLVIHQHNKGMSADVDGWPYRWLMPMVYHHAKVILLSWRLYPDIERIVTRENVLICPNGINVIDNKNKKINDNDTPHLLFLSNLVESKGVFVLLDALKILADKGKDFHCDFVGGETKGIDASIFAEEVNRRQLNQRVSYLGQKYGDEKEQIMSRSDIFVFPSYEDCFPLVLLEAMSYKLPIVTTNEGAIPDEVTDGENGLISERKDSCSLAGCIERLIDNDTLRNIMGEIGYKKLITHFTSDQFELRMKCILEYLCEIDF